MSSPVPHVSSHPLIGHKMTVLRDANTHPSDFRRVLKEITFYLGYEVRFCKAHTKHMIF